MYILDSETGKTGPVAGRNGQLVVAGYDKNDNMIGVKSTQKKFRDSFSGTSLDLTKWDVSPVGAGMGISFANNTMVISAGTVANSEVVLLSKEVFTIPLRTMIGFKVSQRIGRQVMQMELVSVDEVTGLPNEKGVVSLGISGTVATNAFYQVKSGATSPRLNSAQSAIVTTAAFAIAELEPFADEMYFHSRAMDSSAGRSNSYVRHQQIPDPNQQFKLRIRVANKGLLPVTGVIAGAASVVRITSASHGLVTGDKVTVSGVAGVAAANGTYTVTVIDASNFDLQGTVFAGLFVNDGYALAETLDAAPATNTDFTLQFANVVDYAELTAEITAGRGQVAAGQAMGVSVVSMPTVNVAPPAINAPFATVSRGGLYANLSAVALAANATFTSAVQTSFSAAYSDMRDTHILVTVVHNAGVGAQHGTLFVETYDTVATVAPTTLQRVTYSVPVPSDGLPHTFVIPIPTKYYRINFKNGATGLQSAFSLSYTTLAPGAAPFQPEANIPFLLSATNLGVSATFTSAVFDFGTSRTYQTIDLISNSAQSGTVALEQSYDNVTWLRTHSFVSAANAVVMQPNLPIAMRYARVVYVNDAVAQTTMRLHATVK